MFELRSGMAISSRIVKLFSEFDPPDMLWSLEQLMVFKS